MPLYVVNTQMDNLDLDAFVLPYNQSLEKYYTNSYYKEHSLLEFLEKAQNNESITEENLLKKNQVVYYINNSKDEIPAILTTCKLPEHSENFQLKCSNPDNIKERLKYEHNKIIASFYFAEEKAILASFYKKVIKTALNNKFNKISIPIIISNIAESQQYIDFARKTVRNFINNTFDEITVYLQLTDFDNDYFTDDEKEYLKNQKKHFSLYYCNFVKNSKENNEELICLNIDQYIKHKWQGQGAYQKDFDIEGQFRKKIKHEKEKAHWEKLRKQNRNKPTDTESIDKLISERLKIRDESFSEMIMRKIEEKGLSPVSCYKSANVDRKIFSKITKDAKKDENKDGSRFIYHPDKKIALAFVIALHLKQTEAEELLSKAGFSFANTALDIIVKVFIEKGIYDIDLINQQLLKYDQPLLGTTTRDTTDN